MADAGYYVNVQGIFCEVEEAMRRNLARGDDNISAYYAEPYTPRWLMEAANAAAGGDSE